MADNFIKDNKCFKPYSAPVITGNNAYYEEVSGLTATLSSLIGDAESGITIYEMNGTSTTNGYPVSIPVATQSTDKAIMTIIKNTAAMVLFEYDSDLYYCHYYTDTQGEHLGNWKKVTVTSV